MVNLIQTYLVSVRASEFPPVTLPIDLSTSTTKPDIVLVCKESVTTVYVQIFAEHNFRGFGGFIAIREN